MLRLLTPSKNANICVLIYFFLPYKITITPYTADVKIVYRAVDVPVSNRKQLYSPVQLQLFVRALCHVGPRAYAFR